VRPLGKLDLGDQYGFNPVAAFHDAGLIPRPHLPLLFSGRFTNGHYLKLSAPAPGEACDLERALPTFDYLQLPAVLAQQVARELATWVSGISDDCANVRE